MLARRPKSSGLGRSQGTVVLQHDTRWRYSTQIRTVLLRRAGQFV